MTRLLDTGKLLILCAALVAAGSLFPQETKAQNVSMSVSASRQFAALTVVKPVIPCEELAQAEISAAVGAKTHITSAIALPMASPSPYCRVTGYVEPMVKFVVRLPLVTWTQRFVQTGCGGLCGNLHIRLGNDDGCYPAQHGELALASTDMGHTGGLDGQFGAKDYQLRIDFAYRGVHVTTLAAKALITKFYGRAARYSYFSGCSDGGREALMEAERYPRDFNGIAAGAPAMNFTTQNTFYHGWNARKNTGPDGKPILTADKLPILHQAALQACDAIDGLKDGLISDPFSCHFDPAVVECKAEANENHCLTHAQVETARAIYQGAHDDRGNKFVLSGPLPGSELAWAGVYVPNPGSDRMMSAMIATGSLRNLVYESNPPAGYTLNDLKFTPDSFWATTKLHGLYDATDPDLLPFAKSGGKLILWHGLADPHISPLNTIAYYAAMNKVMGRKAVRQFARLYLFPGGYHCGGGEGPFNFDVMSALMAWVERGTAPTAMVASQQAGDVHVPIAGGSTGVPAAAAQSRQGPPSVNTPASSPAHRTRPVYPYPMTAKYNGTGSINDAMNFSPGPSRPVPPSRLRWLGSGFFAPHYEVWCKGKANTMICTANP